MNAPVCPVSRNQPVSDTPPGMPPIALATDLPSAIRALNQMIPILQQLLFPSGRNNVASADAPAPGTNSGQPEDQKWVEVGRTVEQMRINNLDDDSLWVVVDVIKDITWRDKTSGNTLYWKLEL